MLSGDTASPPGAIGPPQPTPHDRDLVAAGGTSSTSVGEPRATAPRRRRRRGRGRRAPVGQRARRRRRGPTASFVPPMSTASGRVARRSGSGHAVADGSGAAAPGRRSAGRESGRVHERVTWPRSRTRRREIRAVASIETAAPRGAPTFADCFDSGRRQHRAASSRASARSIELVAAVPRLRGPPAARGRARRRQDQPGQVAGHVDRRAASAGCSSPPTCCPPTSSASPCGTAATARSTFRPGPVFNNIVLADEINRASPKTQAALLEAMAEGQVTVDGATYPLTPPFMVIATQNPIEHEGTYPLPESQLDRFLMRVSVGYPSPRGRARDPRHATATTTRSATSARSVTADRHRRRWSTPPRGRSTWRPSLKAYLVDLANATRRSTRTWPSACRPGPRWRCSGWPGPGPRPPAAATSSPTTSRRWPCPVLAHRLLVTPEAQLQGITPADALGRGPAAGARPRRPLMAPAARRGAVLTRQGWLVPVGRPRPARRRPAARHRRALRPRRGRARAARRWRRVYVRATRLDLDVDRAVHPARVHAGQLSRVELRVRNLRPPGTRRCCACATPVTGTAGAELLVPPLDRGAASAGAATGCRPSAGASSQVGPLEVVVGDPFGLVAAERRGGAAGSR